MVPYVAFCAQVGSALAASDRTMATSVITAICPESLRAMNPPQIAQVPEIQNSHRRSGRFTGRSEEARKQRTDSDLAVPKGRMERWPRGRAPGVARAAHVFA